ncbi:MlaD family protein [Nocardia sp. NPDC052001]|uniref:MlaD family protein n=1 Tax=Nocardia sp. NPDC052001 TaxID=3154853 RepID=UPI003421B7F9
MQTVKPTWRQRLRVMFEQRSRTEQATRRRELRYGVIATVVVLIAGGVAGATYVMPLGKHTFTAELDEAQSVKPGDDVRLAGIPVGTVKSLDLRPDRVLMNFTVDTDVFVGNETTLDIRMLTLAGGHYVALFPAGSRPLGSGHIPADRVRLPYNLIRAFQDATEPVSKLDGDAWRKNFAALQQSITANPDALRQMLGGVESLVDILNKQNADVSSALAVADEYIGAITTAKSVLGQFIRTTNLLETTLTNYRVEVRETVKTLVRIVDRIAALQPAWQSSLQPVLTQLLAAVPELERLGGTLGSLIDSVQDLGKRLGQLVLPDGGISVDQSAAVVTAPQLCIPVAGKAC